MIAAELISKEIIPLRTSDTGDEALSIMNEFFVRQLPIVNNEQLLGLISEDDILNHDVEEPVGSYQLSMLKPFVQENAHMFEVLNIMSKYYLTVIPVIDEENNYKGLISQEDLMHYFAKMGGFAESGGIIILEMSKMDYSLVEIARIVESENAAILTSMVRSSEDSTRIEVVLKLNKSELYGIIAAFERFNYYVKASFLESPYFDSLKERYESLMRYLNI